MSTGTETRVMVVVEQDLLRSTISDSLEAQGFTVVLQCRDASSAMQAAASVQPQASLLDVSLHSGSNGISIGHSLREQFPEMGLVYLSSCEDPRLLGGTITLPGGAVFMAKDSVRDVQELAEVIYASTKPRNGSGKAGHLPRVDLTDHQVDVLRRLASGSTNAQIGADLNVSAKAVEQSISRIAKRLGLQAGSGNLRVRLATEFLRMTTQ